MINYIEKNKLISDFKDLSNYSYKQYISIKSFPYISITNLGENIITKVFDTLKINNKIYNLENKSINDFINILFEELPDINIEVYEEHDERYLTSHSLFLTDFSSHLSRKIITTNTIVPLNTINAHSDSFNNKYTLESFRVYDEFWQEVPYYKREDSFRIPLKNEKYTLMCLYKVTDLKINFLLEFPTTSFNQLTHNNSGV